MSATKRQTKFEAIGTKWHIEVDDSLADTTWAHLLRKIHKRIEEFDKNYSRFRSDSLVTHMSHEGGTQPLPADGFPLLQFYKKLYHTTDGKVTPLIGQTLVDAGYDAEYSLQIHELQKPAAWEEVISYTRNKITFKQPVLLDFGAAGKGYLVDIIAELLAQAGLSHYLINAGGDILHRSTSKEVLEVGLENPLDTSEAIGIASLTNKSLCASAGSKRKWGTFHHIIDPDELQSPTNIIATWAIADDTMTADGVATALFFTTPDTLLKHFDFSFVVLYEDMTLYRAKDFPAMVFKA